MPQSPDADDYGRFLAGVPARAESPYKHFEADAAWILHAKAFTADWSRFDANRVPVMQAFQRRELASVARPGGTLFYPFGGPDFVTANLFFPSNDTYVLLGLEPPGTVTAAPAFERKPLARTLPRIRSALDSLLRRSFFITDQMDKQVRGQNTDGLVPLLLVQMVRTGHRVRGHRYFLLDPQGRIVDRDPTQNAPRNSGVIIEYQRDGASEVKRLVYLSVNVHNESIKKNAEFTAFIDSLLPFSTFFKSASYLVHRDDFSIIRDLVLAKSDTITQDDTGVPYRFFAKGGWDLMLYGKYTQPYGSFKYRKQPDLKVAFDKGENVRDLGFYIGYGFGRAPSNLLIARKRTT